MISESVDKLFQIGDNFAINKDSQEDHISSTTRNHRKILMFKYQRHEYLSMLANLQKSALLMLVAVLSLLLACSSWNGLADISVSRIYRCDTV